jgi:hypothetical protein
LNRPYFPKYWKEIRDVPETKSAQGGNNCRTSLRSGLSTGNIVAMIEFPKTL